MLDQNDMNLLTDMVKSVFDERLEKSEAKILEKVDERLEKSETKILEKVDERLEKSEAKILEKVDERLEKSESMMLNEIERTREILQTRIDQIHKNLEEMNQYYHIDRLENDNTTLLLKLIDSLSKRVEELERRTA